MKENRGQELLNKLWKEYVDENDYEVGDCSHCPELVCEEQCKYLEQEMKAKEDE